MRKPSKLIEILLAGQAVMWTLELCVCFSLFARTQGKRCHLFMLQIKSWYYGPLYCMKKMAEFHWKARCRREVPPPPHVGFFFFPNFCDSHSCTQALCGLGILDIIFFSGGGGGVVLNITIILVLISSFLENICTLAQVQLETAFSFRYLSSCWPHS